MIPDDFLPHDIVWQEPTTTRDAFGNDVAAYSLGTSIRGWVQQRSTTETNAGRATVFVRDVLFCNQQGVTPLARFTWDGRVFDVDGHPHEVHSPDGYDHTEVPLKRVTG